MLYFRTLDEQGRRSLNTERMLAALSGTLHFIITDAGGTISAEGPLSTKEGENAI